MVRATFQSVGQAIYGRRHNIFNLILKDKSRQVREDIYLPIFVFLSQFMHYHFVFLLLDFNQI